MVEKLRARLAELVRESEVIDVDLKVITRLGNEKVERLRGIAKELEELNTSLERLKELKTRFHATDSEVFKISDEEHQFLRSLGWKGESL